MRQSASAGRPVRDPGNKLLPDSKVNVKQATHFKKQDLWAANVEKTGGSTSFYCELLLNFGASPFAMRRGINGAVRQLRRHLAIQSQSNSSLHHHVQASGKTINSQTEFHCIHFGITLWIVVPVGFGRSGRFRRRRGEARPGDRWAVLRYLRLCKDPFRSFIPLALEFQLLFVLHSILPGTPMPLRPTPPLPTPTSTLLPPLTPMPAILMPTLGTYYNFPDVLITFGAYVFILVHNSYKAAYPYAGYAYNYVY